MANFLDLPNEIILQIASSCQLAALKLSRVCRRLNSLCRNRFSELICQEPQKLRRFIRSIVENPEFGKQVRKMDFKRDYDEEERDEAEQEHGQDEEDAEGSPSDPQRREYGSANGLPANVVADLAILQRATAIVGKGVCWIKALERNRYAALIVLLLCLAPNLESIAFNTLWDASEELQEYIDEAMDATDTRPLPAGLASLKFISLEHCDTEGCVRLSNLYSFLSLPKLNTIDALAIGEEEEEFSEEIVTKENLFSLKKIVFVHSNLTGEGIYDLFRRTPKLEAFHYKDGGDSVAWARFHSSAWSRAFQAVKHTIEIITFDGPWHRDSDDQAAFDSFHEFKKLRKLHMSLSLLCGSDSTQMVRRLVETLPCGIEEFALTYGVGWREAPAFGFMDMFKEVIEMKETRFVKLRRVEMCYLKEFEAAVEEFRELCKKMGVECMATLTNILW